MYRRKRARYHRYRRRVMGINPLLWTLFLCFVDRLHSLVSSHSADCQPPIYRIWEWLAFAIPNSDKAKHPTEIPWRQAFFRTLTCDSYGTGFGNAEFNGEEDEWLLYVLAEEFMTFMRYTALQAAKCPPSGSKGVDETHLGFRSILEPTD
jgi:hypothetical protein